MLTSRLAQIASRPALAARELSPSSGSAGCTSWGLPFGVIWVGCLIAGQRPFRSPSNFVPKPSLDDFLGRFGSLFPDLLPNRQPTSIDPPPHSHGHSHPHQHQFPDREAEHGRTPLGGIVGQ